MPKLGTATAKKEPSKRAFNGRKTHTRLTEGHTRAQPMGHRGPGSYYRRLYLLLPRARRRHGTRPGSDLPRHQPGGAGAEAGALLGGPAAELGYVQRPDDTHCQLDLRLRSHSAHRRDRHGAVLLPAQTLHSLSQRLSGRRRYRPHLLQLAADGAATASPLALRPRRYDGGFLQGQLRYAAGG